MDEVSNRFGRYAENAHRAVHDVAIKVRERVSGWREPLRATSLDGFMEMLDKTGGIVIEVYPEVHKKFSPMYRRKPQGGEVVGFDGMVCDFRLLGWNFVTAWTGFVPYRRKIVYTDRHEYMKVDENHWADYDKVNAQGRWFNEALSATLEQQLEHPAFRFLLNGRDGLREPAYYQDKFPSEFRKKI